MNLAVPYFKQLDNYSGTGWRECFSSSCAMLAAFYGKVKSDDEYNVRRALYGDTTSVTAQLSALKSKAASHFERLFNAPEFLPKASR